MVVEISPKDWPPGKNSAQRLDPFSSPSWLLVSSQKAEKDLSTPDRWRLKRKTQELCGVPARLGLGTPKCIDFATCFGLSRSVFKHQLNEKHANLTKSKHRKVKVENYWLQLVPQNTKNTNAQMCNAQLILTWLKMKEYRSSPKLFVFAYKYVCMN